MVGATMVKLVGFCAAVCGIQQSAKKENQSYLNLGMMRVTAWVGMQHYIQQNSRQCSDYTYRRGCCHHPDRLERVAEIYRSLCRTTCCEKGFRSLKPLAFTLFPPVVTASKLIAGTGWLEIQFGICVDKFMFSFGKEICDFRQYCGGLFPTEI
jgi:hypothetical protein